MRLACFLALLLTLIARAEPTTPTVDLDGSIVHFTYDALGRLIAKQSPWPSAPGEIRTEIYLHDGVRRIQELWREPAQGNGSQGGQNQNNQGPTVYTTYTAREYVHSPGYLDDYICEIDTSGTSNTLWWIQQDASYNVVALVSDGGGSLSRGEVARQYSWSPYGELLRSDIFDSFAPKSRLGHHGRFHDRLDPDILAEPMTPFCLHAVQLTNRTLLAWLGRYAQADPNGTASLVLAERWWFHGRAPLARLRNADARARFRDGLSLYSYLRAAPIGRSDPLGLYAIPASAGGATAGAAAIVGLLLFVMVDQYTGAMSAAVTATGSFISGAYDSAEAMFGYAEA